MFALKFSFVLRYQTDVPRSVIVPLENLSGINLADGDITNRVMAAIEEDDDLLRELFGNYLREYKDMTEMRDIYWKNLQRFQEELILIPVEA